MNVALVAGTTAAGGVRGTDLHATDVLLIVEPNLDPRVEKQLIGRVHRVGQTKRVEVRLQLAQSAQVCTDAVLGRKAIRTNGGPATVSGESQHPGRIQWRPQNAPTLASDDRVTSLCKLGAFLGGLSRRGSRR